MDYTLLKLLGVFSILIFAIKLKFKLWQALILAIAATVLFFEIPFNEVGAIIVKASTSVNNLTILMVLYSVTFLQRMLEKRKQLKFAHQDLLKIAKSNRISATIAPIFIGILPSAAAAIICGDIVKEATCKDLTREEQAFVTSYYRHIPESFLPTYSSVLIMAQLSGVQIGSFVLAMIPVIITLYVLGYVFYVKKVQVSYDDSICLNRKAGLLGLIKHLWSLIAIIILIVGFKLNILLSIVLVIIIGFFVYKFSIKEIGQFMVSAFEVVLLLSTYMTLLFVGFLSHTGVIEQLPDFFNQIPIPIAFTFALLFFFGTIICGMSAVVAAFTVMAFYAVPNAGLPLMVLLMSFAYGAMQLTPVHVCLAIVAEYFHCSIEALIRITLPIILLFLTFVSLYYVLLTFVL